MNTKRESIQRKPKFHIRYVALYIRNEYGYKFRQDGAEEEA
jgi:hypothetical protein